MLVYAVSYSAIAQEALVSAGSFSETQTLLLSQTVGEPFCETLSGNNLILTQGFQQVFSVFLSSDRKLRPNNLSVFPVPTSDKLMLEFNSPINSELSYSLIGINGKTLKTGILTESSTQIDVSQVKPGVYFIKVNTSDDSEIQKIIITKF